MHKREKGEWKQSQVQDNDKVKCALNGLVQSERDKAQPADKVCATEGNGRSAVPVFPGCKKPVPVALSSRTFHMSNGVRQDNARATVQQKPVEDSRVITKPEVTSVSPELTKDFSTVGPIKD
ncbi:hypothetical protein PAMA_018388 [Pampus argenteus]